MEGATSPEHAPASDRGGSCETCEVKKADRGRRDRVREHIRMGGREKRRQKAYSRKESKKMFASQSRSANEVLQSEPLGDSSCGPKGSRELRKEVAGDQGFHGVERLRHEEPGADRLSACGLLQSEVFGGRGQSLWGLRHGDSYGSLVQLQQVWTDEVAPGLEKSKTWAKTGTGKIKNLHIP